MTSQNNRYSRYFTYIKPITRHPIIRNYGHIIFSLLAASFFLYFAVKPTIETIVALQKKLADSNMVLQKLDQKTHDLSQAKDNYDHLPDAVKTSIQRAVPDSLNVHDFVTSIEQSARSHNASLSAIQAQPLSISPQAPNQPIQGLSEIDFLFNIEGNYTDLVSTLGDIIRNPRLITVDKVTFNKSSAEQSLLMSVDGKVYYAK